MPKVAVAAAFAARGCSGRRRHAGAGAAFPLWEKVARSAG